MWFYFHIQYHFGTIAKTSTNLGKKNIPKFSIKQQSNKTKHYSRFPRPIALIVNGCRNANHHTREQVARRVIVFSSGEFTLKDLHKHEEQLNGLQTHPGKCRKKEEMQNSSNHRAHNLRGKKVEEFSHRSCFYKNSFVYNKCIHQKSSSIIKNLEQRARQS